MQKCEYKTDKELTAKHWEILEPLFPEPIQSPKDVPKRAPNLACLEGFLWGLRTGARWRDMSERYPSERTCWRRLQE